jgi:hypothetical protein
MEIDPKKIESIQKVQPPQSMNDTQKFIGKLNFLGWFIFNLLGKINVTGVVPWVPDLRDLDSKKWGLL